MTTILLIRHALTENPGTRITGRTPGIFLSYEGIMQANNLAEQLKDLPIVAIYSSPLERTLQTAAPVAKTLNLSCNISDDFLEINFGKWTNQKIVDLKNDPQFVRFNTFRSTTRIPEGESMIEAQTRTVAGIEKLHSEFQNKTVAIFSHADIIKSAITFYAGIHIDLFHRIDISNASVSIIQFFDDAVRIFLVNGTGRITI
jgi:broad specificity phosphatase PhoE